MLGLGEDYVISRLRLCQDKVNIMLGLCYNYVMIRLRLG
jgi:hypothetical protein